MCRFCYSARKDLFAPAFDLWWTWSIERQVMILIIFQNGSKPGKRLNGNIAAALLPCLLGPVAASHSAETGIVRLALHVTLHRELCR